jgi:hypothetical protein
MALASATARAAPPQELLYFVAREQLRRVDIDPSTPKPGSTMPPYDEAIFALDFAGNAVWRWRPLEVDPLDLAFGAVPNLFSSEVD